LIKVYQGVDIVDVRKLRKVIEKNADFTRAVFTEREHEYCMTHKNHYQHLAGRFAAKEACLKALGRGLSAGGIDHSLQEIEVINQASGRPDIALKGWVSRTCKKKGIYQQTVSISHTKDYAIATVIMLGKMV
jgi:holo-[acyl-carrier protein] synthase